MSSSCNKTWFMSFCRLSLFLSCYLSVVCFASMDNLSLLNKDLCTWEDTVCPRSLVHFCTLNLRRKFDSRLLWSYCTRKMICERGEGVNICTRKLALEALNVSAPPLPPFQYFTGPSLPPTYWASRMLMQIKPVFTGGRRLKFLWFINQ